MPRRNFSMGEYLIRKCDQLHPRHAFRGETAEEWRAWRAALLSALHDRLAPWPEPVPLNAVEEEPFEEDGYLRRRVVFDSEANMSVPAWLLTPKQPLARPCPAVLAVHGHGYGKDDAVGLTHAEATRTNAIRNQGYGYAAEFARRGYVVLAPDFRAWGERELGFKMTHAEPCDYVFLKGILLGITLLTLQIWDGQRSLDYLCSRPEVDADRLACLGLSFGGNLTMWLSAFDERVKAAVMSCFFSTYRAHGIEDWICGNEAVPGVMLEGEMADVVGLSAPRAMLVQNGERDGTAFPIAVAREHFPQVQRIYAAAGAPDRCAFYAGPGGHQFYLEPAVEWVTKWL